MQTSPKTRLSFKISFFVFFGLIAFLNRLIPHLANFALLPCFSELCGFDAKTPKNAFRALTIPIMIRLFSDFFLGFPTGWVGLSVLVGVVLDVMIGFFMRKKTMIGWLMLSSLGSFLFFLITNSAVWWSGVLDQKVSQTFLSYSECLFNGVPFLIHEWAARCFLGAALFSLYYYLIPRENVWMLLPFWNGLKQKVSRI